MVLAVVITMSLAAAPGASALVVGGPGLGALVRQEVITFVKSMPHGPEMRKLHLRLVGPQALGRRCEGEVEGCYEPETFTILAPLAPTVDGLTREEIIAHEYGHHLSANRPGGAYGTPRWDLVEHVCELTHLGEIFPGADNEPRYWANPEEAFAESYASMVIPSIAERWPFAPVLAPTESSLTAIRLDIERPWPRRYAHRRLRASCGHGRDIY